MSQAVLFSASIVPLFFLVFLCLSIWKNQQKIKSSFVLYKSHYITPPDLIVLFFILVAIYFATCAIVITIRDIFINEVNATPNFIYVLGACFTPIIIYHGVNALYKAHSGHLFIKRFYTYAYCIVIAFISQGVTSLFTYFGNVKLIQFTAVNLIIPAGIGSLITAAFVFSIKPIIPFKNGKRRPQADILDLYEISRDSDTVAEIYSRLLEHDIYDQWTCLSVENYLIYNNILIGKANQIKIKEWLEIVALKSIFIEDNKVERINEDFYIAYKYMNIRTMDQLKQYIDSIGNVPSGNSEKNTAQQSNGTINSFQVEFSKWKSLGIELNKPSNQEIIKKLAALNTNK